MWLGAGGAGACWSKTISDSKIERKKKIVIGPINNIIISKM